MIYSLTIRTLWLVCPINSFQLNIVLNTKQKRKLRDPEISNQELIGTLYAAKTSSHSRYLLSIIIHYYNKHCCGEQINFNISPSTLPLFFPCSLGIVCFSKTLATHAAFVRCQAFQGEIEVNSKSLFLSFIFKFSVVLRRYIVNRRPFSPDAMANVCKKIEKEMYFTLR